MREIITQGSTLGQALANACAKGESQIPQQNHQCRLPVLFGRKEEVPSKHEAPSASKQAQIAEIRVQVTPESG
jgi:hypothetical protein